MISLLEVELGLPWPDDRGEEPMPLGDLPVDRCGMAVGDAVALDSWSGHGAPSDDGLADLSYWGVHADAAHARFGGVELGPPGAGGPRGWFDLPVAEAERRAAALADWLSERPGGRGLVWSVDAHTDHHRVERAGRSHPLEAGLVEVAGCPVLGFGWDSGDHSMRHRGERAVGQVYPAALRRAGDGGTVLCWTIPPGEPEEQGEPG
ncbi:hypothetical protein AB0C52_28825 [Streptomyces sp. NPDC048717]|uniref:hypothetical protein n=1 Tax=Streptomyces sp. NPDC048717 TaxID=3154928 RepID=UPI00342C8B77